MSVKFKVMAALLAGAAGSVFAQTASPPSAPAAAGLPAENGPARPEAFPVTPDEKVDTGDLVAVAGVSGAVFDGVLVRKQVATPPGMRVLVTEYTFSVHEWLRGGGRNSVITVRETGGETADHSGMFATDSHKLQEGGRYLVFLRPDYADVLFPFTRVLQVMDTGATVADEAGRIAIGMRNGVLLTRPDAELPSLDYVRMTRSGGQQGVDAGPPQWGSEPIPAQPAAEAVPDQGPIPVWQIESALRLTGGRPAAGRGPAGLSSEQVRAGDWNWCGYVTAAHNFATYFPNNDHWSWFNDAEFDWDNLVSYTSSGWIFGYLTSGGNPIRNENPVANNSRDNAGYVSDAQMIAGGYGSWAANTNPNGICFNWYTNSGCYRIRESDVFINPINVSATDELQFRKSIVHEMGHSIGFGHEDREVAIMVSGTWRVPPNYVLGSYYDRRDETQGGRDMLNWANGNAGASWNIRGWKDMATVSQCHPNWGTSGDVGPYVTRLSTYSAVTGQMIQIQRMYVENRGNQAFTGPVTLTVYFSTNNIISSGDYAVWTGGWSSYPAEGFSNNFNLDITIPASVPSGTYYIGWILTDGETELTSANNTGIMVQDSSGNFAQRTIQITNTVPANDACADATPVGVGTYTGSTSSATNDGSASCGSSAASPDVWYSWTAPCNGTLTVDTCGSTYDTVLSVHSGCPGTAANEVGCNDDDCFCGGTPCRQSRVDAAVAGGTTYKIRVSGFSGLSGNYTLHVNFTSDVPANDACSSATPIGNGSVNGSTSCATNDGCSTCGFNCASPDVWYVYTAPGNGTLHADTCGSGYDTVLSVHGGCPGTAANAIACNDDYCGLQSSVDAPVVAGRQYLICVSGYNGSSGTFTLNTSFAPANDPCSGAIAVGNGATPFTTVGAITDGPTEPNCSFCCGDPQVNQDVWFRYTATCTGMVTVDVCDADYDSKLAAYAGACPTSAGTAIACNDDACGASGLASRMSFAATAGSQYLIRVGAYSTGAGSGTLTIACAAASCYANCDNSTTPPILNVNDFICFQNRFAAGDPYANCDGSTTPPVLNVNDFVCFQNRFAAGCP